MVVDHHLMRDKSWSTWLKPVLDSAEEAGNRVLSMAELSGKENTLLEAEREEQYKTNPPSAEFMKWAQSSDEFKMKHPAPLPNGY
jgi:predicted metallo-beta-lactamase superfamily hydrolase